METLNITKEAEILTEIKEAEKKAEEIVESAKREKEERIKEATRNSSKLLAEKTEEIRGMQEKKLADLINESNSRRNEKLVNSKKLLDHIRAKAEKNIDKAVEFVMDKFKAAVNIVSEPQNKILRE